MHLTHSSFCLILIVVSWVVLVGFVKVKNIWNSPTVIFIWTIGRIGPSTRGSQTCTPRMSLILLLRSLNYPLLVIFMMLLRRLALPFKVGIRVVQKQYQMAKLIRPMKTIIWIVRLIKHCKVEILRWIGVPSSIIVIFMLA